MVGSGQKGRRWDADEGTTAIVGGIAGILVFSLAFGVTIQYGVDLRGSAPETTADTTTFAAAEGLLDTILQEGAGWYGPAACQYLNPNNLTKLGLRDEGCDAARPRPGANGIDFQKLNALNGSTLAGFDFTNGKVDYEEARASLGLNNTGLHFNLTSDPVTVTDRAAIDLGWKEKDIRALYIGDYYVSEKCARVTETIECSDWGAGAGATMWAEVNKTDPQLATLTAYGYAYAYASLCLPGIPPLPNTCYDERWSPQDTAVAEVRYLAQVVQGFSPHAFSQVFHHENLTFERGGDVVPDRNETLEALLPTVLRDKDGRNTTEKYNTIIVGSGVSNREMNTTKTKEAIFNWVRNAGGTLIVLGQYPNPLALFDYDQSSTSVSCTCDWPLIQDVSVEGLDATGSTGWMQEDAKIHIKADINGVPGMGDPSAPLMNRPHVLTPPNFFHMWNSFKITGNPNNPNYNLTVHSSTDTNKQAFLAASKPSKFGQGTILATSWMPALLNLTQWYECHPVNATEQNCDGVRLFRNLFVSLYDPLRVQYGPAVPTTQESVVQKRLVSVYYAPLGASVTMWFKLTVWSEGLLVKDQGVQAPSQLTPMCFSDFNFQFEFSIPATGVAWEERAYKACEAKQLRPVLTAPSPAITGWKVYTNVTYPGGGVFSCPVWKDTDLGAYSSCTTNQGAIAGNAGYWKVNFTVQRYSVPVGTGTFTLTGNLV